MNDQKKEAASDAFMATMIVFLFGILAALLVTLIVLLPLMAVPLVIFGAVWYAFYYYYQT